MRAIPGLPMTPDVRAGRQFVADVIYTPLETEFLKAAKAKGARTMGGAGMCVHQAVRAFGLFTGRVPDVARMKRTFWRPPRGATSTGRTGHDGRTRASSGVMWGE